jgi:hypothetical protein
VCAIQRPTAVIVLRTIRLAIGPGAYGAARRGATWRALTLMLAIIVIICCRWQHSMAPRNIIIVIVIVVVT